MSLIKLLVSLFLSASSTSEGGGSQLSIFVPVSGQAKRLGGPWDPSLLSYVAQS